MLIKRFVQVFSTRVGMVLIILIWLLMIQVKLMCSYCKKHDETEVPDPYYGGPQGFEKVNITYLNHHCKTFLRVVLLVCLLCHSHWHSIA